MTTPVFTGHLFVIEEDNSEQGRTGLSVTNLKEDFLLKANNLSDLPNRNTARENLGIVVSATPPTRPQLNDIWIDLSE